MKVALCTLVVGARYEQLFNDLVLRSWQHYAQAHGYELIIFRKAFSDLPGKSIAWQKLLLLDQPELRAFDKIVWLDADIIIKRGAPALSVPAGMIGYVPDYARVEAPAEWYARFGLPAADDVVQTGVLCLEREHAPILRSAVAYPETPLYEMPALSFRISESGRGFPLDARFNALIGTLLLKEIPLWILQRKILKESLWSLRYPPMRRALKSICAENWFLHAAGAKRDLIKASRCLAGQDE